MTWQGTSIKPCDDWLMCWFFMGVVLLHLVPYSRMWQFQTCVTARSLMKCRLACQLHITCRHILMALYHGGCWVSVLAVVTGVTCNDHEHKLLICQFSTVVSLVTASVVRMRVGEFYVNWRHLWGFSLTNLRQTYQPAMSLVCRIPYFVARVGLVGCALEFLSRIGFAQVLLARIGMWLGLVFWPYVASRYDL